MLLVFFLFGCGSKCSPLSCEYLSISDVSDLRYDIEGDSVALNWDLGENFFKKYVLNAIVSVCVSEIPFKRCNSCPASFSCIINVPLHDLVIYNNKNMVIYCKNKINLNNRYLYKLVLKSKEGSTILESNVIEFKYP